MNYENFKAAYRELFSTIYAKGTDDGKVSDFVAMKGKHYDAQEIRLMIVGRATNGWDIKLNKDSKESFASDAANYFIQLNRFKDEWKMIDEDTNPHSKYKKEDGNEATYYLSKSPFWCSSRDIWYGLTNSEYDKANWYEHIAWSNLYKVAPQTYGNPSGKLMYDQSHACVDILKAEIEAFDPTHILLITGADWLTCGFGRSKEKAYFRDAFINRTENTYKGDTTIVKETFTSNGRKIVVTRRPEGVSREKYTKAVIDAFKNP